MAEATPETVNFSLNKERRFIEVVVDQDVRLGRVVAHEEVEQVIVGSSEFDRKDANQARHKLEEAAHNEEMADQNVNRLMQILGNPEIERRG